MSSPLLQNAYVLHSKAYRENSLICELLTECNGRIAVLARKGKISNPYQPFTPLLLSVKPGQGELYFIDKLEDTGETISYLGTRFYSAFYINELVVKLVKQTVDSESVFVWYQTALQGLKHKDSIEIVLREFELALLDEIGVLPDFSYDNQTNQPLEPQGQYHFIPEQGFVAAFTTKRPYYSGQLLALIAERDWQQADTLKQAKRLMRELIHYQLKGQRLKSRDLFITRSY